MIVFEFPPSAFINNCVKIESLYGTWIYLPLEFSARAAITLPSDVKDKFIAAPSFSLSPVAPVWSALSLYHLKYYLMRFIFCLIYKYVPSSEINEIHKWRPYHFLSRIIFIFLYETYCDDCMCPTNYKNDRNFNIFLPISLLWASLVS